MPAPYLDRQVGPAAPEGIVSVGHRLGAVEALYELSECIDEAVSEHPWPDSSFATIAKLTGRGTDNRGGKTRLIPDDVFTALFQRTWTGLPVTAHRRSP